MNGRGAMRNRHRGRGRSLKRPAAPVPCASRYNADMHVLVTGSSGLIGSEAVTYFDEKGFRVSGVDNNMRADFFGPLGDTTANRDRLSQVCKDFTHNEMDIRDRVAVDALFAQERFDLVIHAA